MAIKCTMLTSRCKKMSYQNSKKESFNSFHNFEHNYFRLHLSIPHQDKICSKAKYLGHTQSQQRIICMDKPGRKQGNGCLIGNNRQKYLKQIIVFIYFEMTGAFMWRLQTLESDKALHMGINKKKVILLRHDKRIVTLSYRLNYSIQYKFIP